MLTTCVLALWWESNGVRWTIAVAAGLFALYLAVLFLTALLEKLHVRQLVPVDDRPLPSRAERVEEALRSGFRRVGLFSDGDKGFREGIVSLLLSENGAELLWILHSKMAGRHQLVTRLADGRWVVTSSVKALTDLSGLRLEEMLPSASLEAMRHYHRRRVAETGQPVAPFCPERVAEDWVEHARERVELIVRDGLGRYRSGRAGPGAAAHDDTVWSYTTRGAARLVLAHLKDLGQSNRQLEMTDTVSAESAQHRRGKN